MSANPRRYSAGRGVALFLGLLCGIACDVQGQAGSGMGRLYLLAATTSQHSPQAYPATLYQVDSNGKLQWLREVVSPAEGTRFIYAYGKTIFLLNPHASVTGVAIVHADDPMRVDDVTFAPRGIIPSPSATVIVKPPGSGEALLVPWITNLNDSATPPEKIEVTSALISGDSVSKAKRVRFNVWSEYTYLRSQGAEGGPNYVPGLIASHSDGRLVMDVFGHSAPIASLPPKLQRSSARMVPVVVGSNDRFLIVVRQFQWEELNSGKLGPSREFHVLDRAQGAWTPTQIEANAPSLRLFDSWLAIVTGFWRPDHQPPPGRENERAVETEADGPHPVLLPPVRVLYRSFVGHNIYFPGVLILQNLLDKRNIRIETGQEDSEVLWVGDEKVLYRVNDTIYQARIEGEKLADTTVVVKDEDVPEIHWVFWSN